MPILIWIGRSSGTLPLMTFPNSASGFSTSSQRSFQILESIERNPCPLPTQDSNVRRSGFLHSSSRSGCGTDPECRIYL